MLYGASKYSSPLIQGVPKYDILHIQSPSFVPLFKFTISSTCICDPSSIMRVHRWFFPDQVGFLKQDSAYEDFDV